MWPPFDENPSTGVFLDNPLPEGRFGSVYIPAFWQVRFIGKNAITRLICASETPFMETDTSGMFFDTPGFAPLCFGNGDTNLDRAQASMLNNMTQLRLDLAKPNTGTLEQGGQAFADRCWLLDRCRNRVSSRLGARDLTSFAPGTEECDSLMLEHCSGRDGSPCDAHIGSNSVLPECSCLLEEQGLVCQGDGCDKEAILPVTCFGGNCNAQGYRFGRMKNQRCSVTLCQQVVNLVGDSISVNSEMQMHCGEPVSQVSSDVFVDAARQRVNDLGQTSGLPPLFVVACLLLLLFFLVLPLSLIVLGRGLNVANTARV
jgi:hypothetical protein